MRNFLKQRTNPCFEMRVVFGLILAWSLLVHVCPSSVSFPISSVVGLVVVLALGRSKLLLELSMLLLPTSASWLSILTFLWWTRLPSSLLPSTHFVIRITLLLSNVMRKRVCIWRILPLTLLWCLIYAFLFFSLTHLNNYSTSFKQTHKH